jgi:hypothetical protein
MLERFRQAVEIYTDSPPMLLPLLNTLRPAGDDQTLYLHAVAAIGG